MQHALMEKNDKPKPFLMQVSPKFAQMIRDATPEQLEQATKIAAKVLIAKAQVKAEAAKPVAGDPTLRIQMPLFDDHAVDDRFDRQLHRNDT